MRYARFTRADFATYRQWFVDAELNRQLGPVDEDWLEYVLADEAGMQFCFFAGDELLAVAGVVVPPTPDEPYVITDLAVQPGRRRQGIGREALTRLLAAEEFTGVAVWEAYVALDRRSDHQDEPILGIPDMLRIGTIPPQPEDTVDSPQVKTLRNLIVRVDWARHDGH